MIHSIIYAITYAMAKLLSGDIQLTTIHRSYKTVVMGLSHNILFKINSFMSLMKNKNMKCLLRILEII